MRRKATWRPRKAWANQGTLVTIVFRSWPLDAKPPKMGSARASRRSLTTRSVSWCAKAPTSMEKVWASATMTCAVKGRWLLSIWLR